MIFLQQRNLLYVEECKTDGFGTPSCWYNFIVKSVNTEYRNVIIRKL